MARLWYDAATRAAIVKAATQARAAGETWSVARQAAQNAGFKGTAGSLHKMLSSARIPAATPIEDRPRAHKTPRLPRVKAPKLATPTPLSVEIDRVVNVMVKQRVAAALTKAMAALESEITGL